MIFYVNAAAAREGDGSKEMCIRDRAGPSRILAPRLAKSVKM